jgi:molecular chaperone GrpE
MSTKHHEHPEKDEKIELGGQQAAPAAAVAPSEGGLGTNPAPAEGGLSAAKPAPEAPQAELDALRERVAALEKEEASLKEENSSLKDQYLRKLADYENFRKRMFRERDDSLKFANAGILADLIPILDDFDRAVDSADHGQDFAVLHDGVGIIRRQLGQLLANKYGLESFESVGQAFDPNIHEALASEPGDVPEAIVSEVLLPGYRLHERVLRSAKVRVKTPAPQAPTTAKEPSAAVGGETAPQADDEAKQ